MSLPDALRQALATEHACVHGLSAALARADEADVDLIDQTLQHHTALRDRWFAELAQLQEESVAAEPAYRLPDLGDRAGVRALARELDAAALAACSVVVAATGPGTATVDASRVRGAALSAMLTLVERADTLNLELGLLPGSTARAERAD